MTFFTIKVVKWWKYLKRTKKCPVKENIIADVSYKGISSNNNLIKKFPSETQLKKVVSNNL